MLIHLITRIFGSRIVFTFTFYVAFTFNFSDFDVGCVFRPALVCCIVVYSGQLLGARYTLIYLLVDMDGVVLIDFLQGGLSGEESQFLLAQVGLTLLLLWR